MGLSAELRGEMMYVSSLLAAAFHVANIDGFGFHACQIMCPDDCIRTKSDRSQSPHLTKRLVRCHLSS